jgi:hypothetical protein
MKYAAIVAFTFLFSLAAAGDAQACRFDTDCAVGSKCLKAQFELEGVCAGGNDPGNDSDRNPYRNQMDTSGKVGNTCSFDTDCGVGNRCFKDMGSIKGVCLPR